MNRESIYTIPYSKMPYGSKIIIYGAGKMGQNYYQSIKRSGRLNIAAILDANVNELLHIWADVPVLEPQRVSELEYDYIFITVENREAASDIRNKLIQYGSDDRKIIWAGDSSDISFEAVNEIHKFTVRALESKRRRFFIFMLPEHGNTGDYAIGYAEQKFLKKYFSAYDIYGVTTNEWLQAKDFFINFVNHEDVIFINGGGYFGDLWGDDVIYKDIVENFPHNKKIFFPNNLTYKMEPSLNNEIFKKDVDWIANQKNLHIFLRERKSFDLLSSYVRNCYLAPDMVFSLHYPRESLAKNGKVLLCLRADCEKTFKEEKKLEELLLQYNYKYDKFDICTKMYFSQDMGRKLLQYIVKKFQQYECVVTDRLHGMILSVIADVPCVAMDNYTHKVSGVYDWIRDMGYALMIEESEIGNISEIIERAYSNKNTAGEYCPQKLRFDNMAETLQKILDTQ